MNLVMFLFFILFLITIPVIKADPSKSGKLTYNGLDCIYINKRLKDPKQDAVILTWIPITAQCKDGSTPQYNDEKTPVLRVCMTRMDCFDGSVQAHVGTLKLCPAVPREPGKEDEPPIYQGTKKPDPYACPSANICYNTAYRGFPYAPVNAKYNPEEKESPAPVPHGQQKPTGAHE